MRTASEFEQFAEIVIRTTLVPNSGSEQENATLLPPGIDEERKLSADS